MCYNLPNIKGWQMAKIDKIKEEISLFKFWLGISLALVISIISWILTANHNWSLYNLKLIGCSITTIIIFALIAIFLSKKIRKKLKELEKL